MRLSWRTWETIGWALIFVAVLGIAIISYAIGKAEGLNAVCREPNGIYRCEAP